MSDFTVLTELGTEQLLEHLHHHPKEVHALEHLLLFHPHPLDSAGHEVTPIFMDILYHGVVSYVVFGLTYRKF